MRRRDKISQAETGRERKRERWGGGERGRAERGREGGREGGCEGVEFRLRFKEERLERVENVLSHTTK